ncbi:tagatose 6-phosphate aldolase 1, kbaY subunit [Xenorhabdus cabanillasii JM26]|nr:tagatose 6-phosphate aldolase 1, kbaY subunit [Xenorhabdus cabanillasii JM26]
MLISNSKMLKKAQREGYAVPAFNVHNLETEYPDANDPRKYITPGKLAMQKVVENKIIICGSAGRI